MSGRQNTFEDFWQHVAIGEPGECWEWVGYRSLQGYGRFGMHGKKRIAHRVAYEIASGRNPGALSVCHRCDNPPCCNPAHLFLGTAKDNAEDRDRKGRNGAAKLSKPHCRRGHPLTPENTYIWRGRQRHCLSCRAENGARTRAAVMRQVLEKKL